ncbi:MAG: type secretion system protein GspD [Pseudomonadota bacterium]|jgi:general secretion pathway protein D
MNLKIKQLVLLLCGLSLINTSIAANISKNNSSGNLAKVTNASTKDHGDDNLDDDKVVLNFENADIQAVIKAISKLSGKNFVIDPRVKGTINIVSEKPISKAESYKVLESALRMQGFATVEADGVIKVLPETDARTYGMKIDNQGSATRDPGDQLITRIFNIDSGSATHLANTLRPMISPNNTIAVYPSSNSLVVTDYASNMNRISKVINELKATQATKVEPVIIKLKYATAADIVQTLQNYLGNSSSGGSGGGNNENGAAVNITVDANSNSIILTSNSASRLDDLKKLAISLDTQAAGNNNNLHVVYLKNADAAHVADVLRVIASGQENPDLTASAANRSLSDTSSMFNQGSGGGGGSTPFGGGSAHPTSNSGGGGGSSRSTPGSSNDKNAPKVLIQAEPTTNALIIQAPEAIYRNLRMAISLLDVRRVQVMIEALIADVSTSEQGTFGIQWIGGAGNNNVGVGVISNYAGGGSNATSLAGAGAAIAGGAKGGSGLSVPSIPNEVYVGLVTGTTTIGGQTIPSISTLADMLSANSSNNILGRPTLLTLDNEEASIFVGSNVGVPSGSFQNSAAAPGSISNTVSRQDVGTILRIKPLVTQNGSIQLSVYEEDSQVNNSGMTPALLQTNGPNFDKRNLKTQILVDDGQIIALGGMTSDVITLQNAGIPILSSIPYLGWLFSWQSRVHDKKNMVIFLRPVIIRNQDGYKALTNQRYSYIMGQQNMIQAKGNALFPRIDAVNLENQVPYDNKIPPQTPEVADSPIIDLTTASKKTASSANNNTSNMPTNSAQPASIVDTVNPTYSLDKNVNPVINVINNQSTVSSVKARVKQDAKGHYISIQSGDTLYSIARENSVSIEKLYKINHLKPKQKLELGSKIYLD